MAFDFESREAKLNYDTFYSSLIAYFRALIAKSIKLREPQRSFTLNLWLRKKIQSKRPKNPENRIWRNFQGRQFNPCHLKLEWPWLRGFNDFWFKRQNEKITFKSYPDDGISVVWLRALMRNFMGNTGELGHDIDRVNNRIWWWWRARCTGICNR